MAGSFKLEDYETVKQRKARFKGDYPDGRIVVRTISDAPREYAFFEAFVFATRDDQKDWLPIGTGHALELREWEKQINRYGKEYESVNYTSWTENCEESAVGRALDNAGYASSPSRNEMDKVQRASESGDPLADEAGPAMTEEHLEIARQDVREIVKQARTEGLINEEAEGKALAVVDRQKTLAAINGCKASYSERFNELRQSKAVEAEEKELASESEKPESELF